jgi:hypothetical protein
MEIYITAGIRGWQVRQISQLLFFTLHIIPFTLITE